LSEHVTLNHQSYHLNQEEQLPEAAGLGLALVASLLGIVLALAAAFAGKPWWLVMLLWPTGAGLSLVGLGWLAISAEAERDTGAAIAPAWGRTHG
jgi:fatty acid desaturase